MHLPDLKLKVINITKNFLVRSEQRYRGGVAIELICSIDARSVYEAIKSAFDRYLSRIAL